MNKLITKQEREAAKSLEASPELKDILSNFEYTVQRLVEITTLLTEPQDIDSSDDEEKIKQAVQECYEAVAHAEEILIAMGELELEPFEAEDFEEDEFSFSPNSSKEPKYKN
jgi:predicted RND superfamily exporter protein